MDRQPPEKIKSEMGKNQFYYDEIYLYAKGMWPMIGATDNASFK